MAIQPQTDLFLIKNPLEIDNKNQILFSNATTQANYFQSLPKLEIDNISYQRKDNIIRYPANIDSILEYNYCMYKNENYSNKWFYAFITNMEYINDNMTAISIKTDVFQTWQFNFTFKPSFVEREHVNDDSVGKNIIPEGLETGDYVIDDYTRDNELLNLSYVIQCTEWTNSEDKPLATSYGGVFAAGGAYICTNINEVVSIINAFAQAGKSDAVYAVYMVPSKIINNTSGSLQYSGQNSPVYYTKSISKPTSLDSYTPINNKLLTYPYIYLELNNNNGISNILKYENFNDSNCIFEIKGVPTVGGSIKCSPNNYEDSGSIETQGILAGKFPTLSWSEDAYTNWLTQNSVNIGVGLATSGLEIAGGVGLLAGGAGAGANAVLGGGIGIAQQLGQLYQHSFTPNSAKGNLNGGDINTCSSANTFYFYNMSIKSQIAKTIDNYFSMYGYKINEVKIPNLTGRPNWNYVKTINANIEGYFPQSDLQEIKDMFNTGLTLWHNTATFLDYSQNNK